MARILGDGQRTRARAFTELISHYLFRDRFGRPGKGNDKGKVEGLVKYTQRRFMTPRSHRVCSGEEARHVAVDSIGTIMCPLIVCPLSPPSLTCNPTNYCNPDLH